MAFQKQFKTSYYSYNGWEYYMEIWVNTTAGTITTSEVKLGTGGPIISYDTDNEDRFSPIISSNCVIPLVIESSIQETFVKQLREVYNERDVYVHLYRATEAQHSTVKPLWSGFVLMDLSSTPDEFYPYDFKITAVDGLGLLKDIDFVKPTTRRANEYIQADMYYGPGRFTYWLKEILLKTGASTTVEGSSQDYEFTTAINWYESQMPNTSQSTDPFYITKCSVGMFHTKTDDGVYEVTNCYEVLKELLKHWGARITYWKGQFWIVQIPQYITPDSGTYINPDNVNTRTYDKSGTFIGSSDNLGDSYWTRYQLNIGDIDGGIQKLTGTNVNYLPQIREVRANNISFGGGNRYGGFPREFAGNSAPDEIIFQDQINDASDSDSFNLVIPLNVTVQNGNPFFMKILFNFYCTDLTNTYYLQYDTTLTHKYYWVDISQWTTLVKAPTWDSGFISPATGNSNQSQSHSNLEGFNQNILFKLYNTSTQVFSDLDLSGDYKFYLDIDPYGTNISNPGSFRFKLANAGPSGGQFFYPTHPSIDVTWTNTLQSNYSLQTPNIITNNAPNGNSIIQLTTPNIDPFEGMFVVITNTTGSIYGNSYVSSVNTSDVAIVDFGTLIFGDTLQISDLGSLQVYNGSTFVKSSSSGNWGVGILTGSLAFTQILLDEYLYGQTVVIESPSMRLVTSEVNKQSSDGSGLRPNYVNPIGRLKESRTNLADVQYVFKRGAFYTLTDEWDYDGFEIKRNVDTIVKTVKNITGPNNPVTGVGSVPKTTTVPNAFGQVISKQIITSISSSVAAGTITSLPIALINDVIFKIGDYFNVLNSDTNEFIKFELNAQQFSDSSSLTVVSQVIADNIPANSIITFNAFDLTSQYQNKTRGTVGAFDITATSIDSGSVAISSYIDDDTFATASVNSLATSESIKAYVDGQAGHDETLQQVTDNGNTTTNSITIGSSNSPQELLHLRKSSTPRLLFTDDTTGHTDDDGFFIGLSGTQDLNFWNYENTAIRFATGSTEKMRLTSGGSLLLGTTSPSSKMVIKETTGNTACYLTIDSASWNAGIKLKNSQSTWEIFNDYTGLGTNGTLAFYNGGYRMTMTPSGNLGINVNNATEKLHVVGDALITGDSHADAFKPAATGEPIKFKNFASTEVGRFTDGGNLGLGTTSPSSMLTLKGTNPFIRIERNGVNTWSIQNNYLSTTFGFSINNINTATTPFFISEAGNIGINQTSPTEKLHVVGDALITGDSHADAFKPAASGEPIKFKNFGSTEVGRFTDGGNFLVGTTTDNGYKLDTDGEAVRFSRSGKSIILNPNFAAANTHSSIGTSAAMGLSIDIASLGQVMRIGATGTLKLDKYNSTNNIGTPTYLLGTDIDGNIVKTTTIPSGSGGPYLPLTGGTLTGDLLLGTTSAPVDLYLFGDTAGTSLTWSNSDDELQFSDNTKVTFGDGQDLQVYYDGVDGAIKSSTGIQFLANSATKMTLTSGGNLGIGTTSPSVKLSIQKPEILNNEVNVLKLGDDTNGLVFKSFFDSSGVSWRLNKGLSGVNMMTFSQSGNVGVGITNPTEKLHVVGDALITGDSHADAFKPAATGEPIKFKNFASTEVGRFTDGGNLLIGTTTDNNSKLRILGATSDSTKSALEIRNSSSSGLFTVRNDGRIDATGAVNLTGSLTGTTATFSGDVSIDSGSNSQSLIVDSTNNTLIRFRINGASAGFIQTTLLDFIMYNAHSGSFRWLENGGTERMRLTDSGNLLIGTTTDSGEKLQVTGAIKMPYNASNLYYYSQNNGSIGFGKMFPFDNSGFYSFDTNFTLANGGYKFKYNGSEKMRLTSGGNLGIGTTNPAHKLSVFGGNIEIHNGGATWLGSDATGGFVRTFNGNTFRFLDSSLGETMRIVNSTNNVLIGSTSDNGAKLQVTGIIRTTGGSVQAGQDYGFTLEDESNNNRYGLKFGAAGSVGGSNLLMLTNRSLSSATGGGEVAIGANASTTGVTETEVVRIKAVTQSEVSIDGILSLTVQDTPADPSNNKSSIWLDSNWDLKIKITNSSGDTVTKTIVEYA